MRVLGPYRGAEEAAFLDMVALFEEQNPDIDVLYSTSAEFERLIDARIRAGDPPDVAVFAEPSVIARLARRGYLAPLWNEALAVYEEQYTSAWVYPKAANADFVIHAVMKELSDLAKGMGVEVEDA